MNDTLRTTSDLYRQYLVGNYAHAPIALVRGRGVRVWDEAGRSYLDFASGIAVNALAHVHPHWVRRVQEQAAELVHCSNLFMNPLQAELARRLVERAGGDGKILFCNSGTEANEALLKLARLHGRARAGREGVCYRVVCAQNAFHGRTFGGMAATPQEKIQGGFRPMLDGFDFAPLNDLEAFRQLVGEHTAAIFVETIQGEGGIHPCTSEFLRGVRQLCDERGLLLILDEVQCGAGRTGRYFAYEWAGIRPDAIGMAKGIGGGFPLGAIWVDDRYTGLFTPGSHGSTFAGSPLACAAGLAVQEIIDQEDLLGRIRATAPVWRGMLEGLMARHPGHVREVRGLGYLTALGMTGDPSPYVNALREAGLLTARAGSNAVRLLPPLNVTVPELEEAVALLDRTLAQLPPPANPAHP